MPNNSLVLRPKTAASLLEISIATFWRLVKDGKLQTIKLSPRCTGIRRSDIDRYLENLK
ncbi:MAG: helix-turn-helix transcriptional regulator [Methylobacter sp.]